MTGKPQNGRRKALTPTQRQRRWRAKMKGAVKRTRRDQRERAMAERTIAASQALVRTTPLYGVIFADPPWRFEPYSRITGLDRSADNHYATMALDEIKALPIPAAPDCVLFLCATAPMLPQALEVMAAWGFAYRTPRPSLPRSSGAWRLAGPQHDAPHQLRRERRRCRIAVPSCPAGRRRRHHGCGR
jgi:hypothetical protein